MSDLVLVNEEGEIVEGKHEMLNRAAFAIHSRIHAARPDAIAAAHAHSIYGKTWSALGRKLDPITQDACAFYEDHAIFDDYTGVVSELDEGDRIAKALGDKKSAILKTMVCSPSAAQWKKPLGGLSAWSAVARLKLWPSQRAVRSTSSIMKQQ